MAGRTTDRAREKPPWRARKEAYIAKIATKSASTRLVSTSDKLHNARAILADYRVVGEDVWKRFTGGRDGTLWYYRSLVDAFARAGRSRLGIRSMRASSGRDPASASQSATQNEY